MNVNGVTVANNSVQAYESVTKKSGTGNSGKESSALNVLSQGNTEAAVYEASSATSTSTTTYKSDPELVARLQAEAEERTAQLKNLVQEMFAKQGNTLSKTDDMWKFLASGDYTVDAETQAKAQEDISEDGYWGVQQTSQRIFDFAKALSGGDPEVMEKMKEAVTEGFKQATDAWGEDLPDISSETLNAVMKLFDDYSESFSSDSAETVAE